MVSFDHFKTFGTDLEQKLAADDAGYLNDDTDEEAEFEQRIWQEIVSSRSKKQSEGPAASRSVNDVLAEECTSHSAMFAPAFSPQPVGQDFAGSSFTQADAVESVTGLPSTPLPLAYSHAPDAIMSRNEDTPSRILNMTLVFGPTVSTPNDRPPLPGPPSVATRSVTGTHTFDSPINVETPIQTPGSVGQGRRDDPTTPIALGKDVSARFKGKDLQNLSKLRLAFTIPTSTDVACGGAGGSRGGALRGRGRGRGRGATTTARAASGRAVFGSDLFKDLRFCLAVEPGAVSKQQTRCEAITKRGGAVVFQPDTAITHVVFDGSSEKNLRDHLGIETLSALPEGTVCIKYNWVEKCIKELKLIDTKQFLSFPPTTLTRPPGRARMADITHQLRRSARSGGYKRRSPASSDDSETDSPERPAPGLRDQRRIEYLANQDPRWSNNAAPSDPLTAAATRHELPKGPGWVQPAPEYRDDLDKIISGVKEKTIIADDYDSDHFHEDSDDESQERNPNPMADRFKCGQKHTGNANEGPNEWLAKKFDELFHIYEGQVGKNDFAKRGYQRAAGILRRTSYPIKSGAQAMTLKFIGQSLADRIDEFISGEPGRLHYEDTSEARAISIFKDCYGIGPKQAYRLVERGARTLDDLKTQDFGLTDGQKVGLDLYDELVQRIPREECRQIFDKIRTTALAIEPKLWIEIMGSYRRGQPHSGDVDILITRDTSDGLTHVGVIKRLVRTLCEQGFITHHLSEPHDWDELEAKWMGVGRMSINGIHRRIDILCIPYENWGAALLYFTGNDVFNRSMRLYARKKGYSLNQRGLYKGVIRDRTGQKTTEGVIVASRTEQEIFDMLGIRWRPPEERRP